MGLNQSSFMFTMCFRKSFELIKSADEIGGIFLYEFKDVSEKVKDLCKRLCLPDLSKDNSSCCKKKPLSKLFFFKKLFSIRFHRQTLKSSPKDYQKARKIEMSNYLHEQQQIIEKKLMGSFVVVMDLFYKATRIH